MAGRIRAAIDWWIDGLAGATAAVADRLRGRAGPLRASVDDAGGWTLFDPEGLPVGRIADSPDSPVPDRLLRGRRVEAELPAERIFRAELPPVPPESEDFLAAIVEHRVDRLSPWRRGDRLTGFQATHGSDGQIAVSIAATARQFVAPVLAAAEAGGAREFVVIGVPRVTGDPAMTVRFEAAEGRVRRLRGLATGALAVFIVAVVGAAAWMLVEDFALDGEIPELQQQIDDRMAVMRRARSEAPADAGALDPVDQAKHEAPVAVVVLEALSRLLPDDTSLSSLRIEDGHAKIAGVTRSLGELVPRLVASPDFSDATSADPTERLDDGSDRFSLDLVIVPRSSLDPS